MCSVWQLAKRLSRPYFSPSRNIRSLPTSSVILGNISDVQKLVDSSIHEEWIREYGTVLRVKLFLNDEFLMLMDTRALSYVLLHSTEYTKPEDSMEATKRLFGAGILAAEGERHRHQRRVMNPSFGLQSVRELTPVMFDKAVQLRDIWLQQTSLNGEPTRIEVLSWLSRTTLDIIGLAGFNYEFNALNVNEKPNELNEAFSAIFNMDSGVTLTMLLQGLFPILQRLPTARHRAMDAAMKTMRRVGSELVQEHKKLFMDENDVPAGGAGTGGPKDLLSLLVKANLDSSIPESQRMSDEDVLSQIPTFLMAGHETSSTQLTWTLFSLAQHPDIQKRLRDELLDVSSDTPSMDDLQSLPFLDAVLRESLRLHPAVPLTIRQVVKDDVITLGEPVIDKNGKLISEVRVRKGDQIFIPITAINRMSSLWGPDAQEFNPDRWKDVPEPATSIPSIFSNILTFFAGARACIGYRFAVVEMKAILFTLIRTFEFRLAIPAEEFTKRQMVVTRPYLKNEKNGRAQMPLLVTPYLHSEH
ncbi:cytochrome P450 [Schizopora paradoxa]|uniref:Cytochrome P450 n=1 Tax=Schizopora paradoxa TaxID=27342 RepID=A0A0H2RN40_9AGAM|nr:cytochrome P450 [Schizopora paradoxa]